MKTTKTFRESISIALAGFIVATISGLAAALAGFGARWGWWQFMTGFVILKWAAVGGIAASLATVLGFFFFRSRVQKHLVLAAAALIVGLAVAGTPLDWLKTAQRSPQINDITTDTENPPRFVSILPLRKDATSPAEYGGPKIAAQQVRAVAEGSRVDVRSLSRVGLSDVGTNARWIEEYMKVLKKQNS